MLVGLLLCGFVLVVCRLLICAGCLCYVNSVDLRSSLVYTIVALLCLFALVTGVVSVVCCWDLFVWLTLGFVFTFRWWLLNVVGCCGLILLRWFSINSVG